MPDAVPRAPYRVHRMIQDLLRDPKAARTFAEDPQSAFERYGIAADEAELLETRGIAEMGQLGVHPNLQMKYLRLRRPSGAATGPGALDAYLERLRED